MVENPLTLVENVPSVIEKVQSIIVKMVIIIKSTNLMIKKALTLLFGALMMTAGIAHFIKPETSLPFIPDFMPKMGINYAVGIIEIVISLGMYLPKYQTQAAWGIFFLMVAFLPLHIADVFKESPAIGSHQAALIRLPIQFVLIGWAWFIKGE